jgi:hypothetical protein
MTTRNDLRPLGIVRNVSDSDLEIFIPGGTFVMANGDQLVVPAQRTRIPRGATVELKSEVLLRFSRYERLTDDWLEDV